MPQENGLLEMEGRWKKSCSEQLQCGKKEYPEHSFTIML